MEIGDDSVEEGLCAELEWTALSRVKPRCQLLANLSVYNFYIVFGVFFFFLIGSE